MVKTCTNTTYVIDTYNESQITHRMTLTRQNASTPDEIEKAVSEYLENNSTTKPFCEYFTSKEGRAHVYTFLQSMSRTQSPGTIEKFARYHTKERFDVFREMFPPPGNMCEIWNAWDRKGRPSTL